MSEHAAELKRLRGMTLIAEDAQIRPAAMSHVKPSEYRYYAERAMQQMVDDIATHATALATVQDLHREAVAERDQVTRELEEAKRSFANILQIFDIGECEECGGKGWYADFGNTNEPEQVQCRDCAGIGYVQSMDPTQQQLATARRDALQEAREKVKHVPGYRLTDGAYIPVSKVLSILGAEP